MKNIQGMHFLERFKAAACIGCIVDINMESRKGKTISKGELEEIVKDAVEIRLYDEAWFSTYDIYYRKELRKGMARVVMSNG